MLKEKIKRNIKGLIVFLLLFILIIPLPYYIEKDGGTIPISDRINIESNDSSGNFYMAYVSEIKVNIPIYIYSLFNKEWTLIPKKEVVLTNESEEDVKFRNKTLLKESIDNAIISAYNLANKEYTLLNEECFITYVDEEALTDLKVQDKIIKVNDIDIKNKDELIQIISKFKIGDIVKFEVQNKEQLYNRTAKITNIDGKKSIGIMISTIKKIETNPKILNNFDENESGSSGGLMLALDIYERISNKNISKNQKIAGTGTIDEDGNIGQIGGVKYKIKGAYNDGIKIFLVPNGDNYNEAIKVKNEYNLDINIIGVSTLKEAITKLEGILTF